MKKFKIAVIPGDGIGKEVMPEGLRALEAAGRKFGIQWTFDELDWSCDYHDKHGRMMPEDGLEQLQKHDAVYFGAVGWPAKLPDHISLWGLLIPFRRGYDQYVNLRPVRLMPGMKCPLAGRKPGDIDFWVVRENSEGEQSSHPVDRTRVIRATREFDCHCRWRRRPDPPTVARVRRRFPRCESRLL
jgi:tartrate dehydrogenase/decarboxylase/D-malate dehydrogenase